MKRYEWADKMDAMKSALEALNTILLGAHGLEETARDEALAVRAELDVDAWDEAALIDRLKQAALDAASLQEG